MAAVSGRVVAPCDGRAQHRSPEGGEAGSDEQNCRELHALAVLLGGNAERKQHNHDDDNHTGKRTIRMFSGDVDNDTAD